MRAMSFLRIDLLPSDYWRRNAGYLTTSKDGEMLTLKFQQGA